MGTWGLNRGLLAALVVMMASARPATADDLLGAADRLAHQHLPYVYGSGDLRNGGLDCSGFVQIVFREAAGINLPDQADKQMDYCRDHGRIWDAESPWTPATLQPGDLIFFAGPDSVTRSSEVSHVMIYAGHGLMVGSQGRGHQIDGTLTGVGYYRIGTPRPDGIWGESGLRFIGRFKVFAYGRLPLTPEQLGHVRAPMLKTPMPSVAGKPVASGPHYE